MSEDWRGGAFVAGAWRAGKGAAFEIEDPAENVAAWTCKGADGSDVADAVAAAESAFPGWAATPLEARMAILERYRDLVRENADKLAGIISTETGKPFCEAQTEAAAVGNKVDVTFKAYETRTGTVETASGAARGVLRHKPHGVMGVLGPFNFPAHLANGHMVPALLAGNTVVFKPSELAPGAGAFIVSLMAEAGVPAGAGNLVQGGREVGEARAGDDRLAGLLFTGGVKTGLALHKQFAGRPEKMLALELGGNNPLIWWDAEDLEAAAYTVIQSAFLTSGQRCTCARRLIVPEGKAGDAAIDALIAMTNRIRVGKPHDDPKPFMGPVISGRSAEGLARAFDMLAERGRVLRPLARVDLGAAFVSPGIVDVTEAGDLPDEEQFGPLLQVYRVKTFDDAVARANATRFGLSAGLLSADETKWTDFLHRSRAGIVNWNRQITGASSSAPFGGIGLSGNHRPSAFYAADYCAYPVASTEAAGLAGPGDAPVGLDTE